MPHGNRKNGATGGPLRHRLRVLSQRGVVRERRRGRGDDSTARRARMIPPNLHLARFHLSHLRLDLRGEREVGVRLATTRLCARAKPLQLGENRVANLVHLGEIWEESEDVLDGERAARSRRECQRLADDGRTTFGVVGDWGGVRRRRRRRRRRLPPIRARVGARDVPPISRSNASSARSFSRVKSSKSAACASTSSSRVATPNPRVTTERAISRPRAPAPRADDANF